MRVLITILITLAALPMASCTDHKTEGAVSYGKALQAWYDAHPVCVVLIVAFPYELRLKGREGERRRYDALADAGLLAAEPFRKDEADIRGGTVPADYIRYRVTDAGTSVLHPVPAADNTQLCFAKNHVVAVKNATEPADAMGVRTTRVTYDWKLDNVAPWASSPAVRENWPLIASALDQSAGEATDMLIQTDKGWRREGQSR